MFRNSALVSSFLPRLATVLLFGLLLANCGHSGPRKTVARSDVIVSIAPGPSIVVKTASAEFHLLPSGYLQASLLRDGQELTIDDAASNQGLKSDLPVIAGREVNDCVLDLEHAKVVEPSGRLGSRGKKVEVTGKSQSNPSLEEVFVMEVYDELPDLALTTVSYKNSGATEIVIDRVLMQQHVLNASLQDHAVPPFAMWSFHGSSEAWGKDDVMQISAKFMRANPMQTMMHNDENQTGGGIPVVAFWTKSVGEAIGHAETFPLQLSLPVQTLPDGSVDAKISMEVNARLRPGDTYTTPVTFVSVFHGDFYEPLSMYSKILRTRGVSLAHPTNADYQANWCGWGY